MSSETMIFRLPSDRNSYQNETTTKKSLMFEHKGSVQHGKDGGRVEHANTRSRFKTNRPPSYVFSADRNKKLSEMFLSTLGLKMDTSFGGVFELNNVEHQHLGIALLWFAAVSIQRNRVVSLDKSILYSQFLCKTSDSTFVLVVFMIMFKIVSVVNARK